MMSGPVLPEGKEKSQKSQVAQDQVQESEEGSDNLTLFTGWSMLSIAIFLMVLSLSIYLYGLQGIFSTKKFPEDTDTPCALAFLVLGIIFVNIGIVYRDMAVHPEFFEDGSEEKEKKEKHKHDWDMIKKKVRNEDAESDREILDGGSQ